MEGTMLQGKHEDLEWLAFQYIAGELAPGAAELFEERLAGDQAAREAVAAAVQIAQTIALESDLFEATPSTGELAEVVRQPVRISVSRFRSSRYRSSWRRAGVAAAGLLLALTAWTGWKSHIAPARLDVARNANSAESSRLAAIWADAQFDPERSSDWQCDPLRAPRSAAGEEEDDADVLVPEWLLAAVSVQPAVGESPDERPLEN
jgi:anti-sigma-K factor RskA